MSEKFELEDLDDIALEDNKKPEKLDMELESPTPTEIEARIKEVFPNEDIIRIDENFELLKMAAGNYRLNNTVLKDCTADELNKVDVFLRGRKE